MPGFSNETRLWLRNAGTNPVAGRCVSQGRRRARGHLLNILRDTTTVKQNRAFRIFRFGHSPAGRDFELKRS